MLTPGSPRPLYDWQYHHVSRLLAAICPEVGLIVVAGYSFPAYDQKVHAVLSAINRLADNPPVLIVNPAVEAIPPALLRSIFPKCESHAIGFGEFDWPVRGEV
jgi:hypothetical protein